MEIETCPAASKVLDVETCLCPAASKMLEIETCPCSAASHVLEIETCPAASQVLGEVLDALFFRGC